MSPSPEAASGPGRRVLHVARFFPFDTSNGASVANLALLRGLAGLGFKVEAIGGTIVDTGEGADPAAVLAGRGLGVEVVPARGGLPNVVRARIGAIPVAVLGRPLRRYDEGDHEEAHELLALVEEAFERSRPDVVVSYGGDPLTREILSRARARGVATVFTLHNFAYPYASTFNDVDAVLVASRFSAEHHRRSLGIECAAIPYWVDASRAVSGRRVPNYLTFVNPSPEKGVYAFARIADELGRARPDIPILVVEGRGTERTLADCGIDLTARGNVHLLGHTPEPARFWAETRLCLLPSLWWENQPLVAVEAMLNGIPVIGSDRGGVPEALGASGVVLPLPARLTPSTRELPTAEEVAPWVEAIVGLWDDRAEYDRRSRLAAEEARRWSPEALGPAYARFFGEVRPRPRPEPPPPELRPEAAPPREIAAGLASVRERWPEAAGDDGGPDDAPVFVLAAGWRSGSTMLQRMLSGSCFVWGEPYGHAALIDAMAEPIRCVTGTWPEPHHIHDGRGRESHASRFVANLYPPLDDLRAAQRAFFDRLFSEPARRAGATRWGIKEVRLGVDHAAYLRWLFPRAKFLFLLRNPYDAWRSLATRAGRGWKWFHRWPDRPVTVRSFAEHWRRLALEFAGRHAEVGGLLVRHEDLARGDHGSVEAYLGFPLSAEAARSNPSDGGPAEPSPMLDADRLVLDEVLGTAAARLGYRPEGDASPRQTPPVTAGPESVVVISAGPSAAPEPPDPSRCVVLVPVGHHVEPACDDALRELERRGYAVRRVRGYSAIDQGRNQIATDALRDGFDELMWVDSDIAFHPDAVERLRSHGLPIACGIYPKKGPRSFASNFAGGTRKIVFGSDGGLVEIPYAGAGFLHTRREVYRAIQDRLGLPPCNERFGPSMVPFFHPLVVDDGPGHWYLAEDFSFCHRARRCGFRILADTTIRLRHIGSYAYGWEDAGGERDRFDRFDFYIND